jgi:deazaflavin-dependent oxidoreductase (nitroreductase family)
MPLTGEYAPSTFDFAREQVELYERTGGKEGNVQHPTGLPIIILTTLGAKSGKLRKTPLMRVEHEGKYAIVASKGGTPENPTWYNNVKANPLVELQDGPAPKDYIARELSGDEKQLWSDRADAAYPPYAEYRTKTDRDIPIFVLEPVES